LLDVQSKKIGLRTIKIVQEPDKDGASFYVELNGRPIFAKGANYIPSDVFIPRVTDQQYQWLIHSTANANMGFMKMIFFMTFAMNMVSSFGKILCLLAVCFPEMQIF
jgi:beta-mannosidase